MTVRIGKQFGPYQVEGRGRDGSALETIGEPARFTDDLVLSPTESVAMVQIRADEVAVVARRRGFTFVQDLCAFEVHEALSRL